MAAAPTIPDGVTKVVVKRGAGRGHHHRPRAGTDEPAPACGAWDASAGWKEKEVDVLEPFLNPCAYCFDEEEPRGPGQTVTGP